MTQVDDQVRIRFISQLIKAFQEFSKNYLSILMVPLFLLGRFSIVLGQLNLVNFYSIAIILNFVFELLLLYSIELYTDITICRFFA